MTLFRFILLSSVISQEDLQLTRISHESLAATTDMTVRTGSPCDVPFRYASDQSRGTAGRLPGGTPILAVSPQQFMRYPGEVIIMRALLVKIVENKEAQIIPIRGINFFPLILKIYLTYT
jgi:hypothetical protein